MLKIFLPPGAVNDATDYYVSLIERALAHAGMNSQRVGNITGISHGDIVVTVVPFDAFKLKVFRRRITIINWFQGIGPQEYRILHGKKSFKSIIVFQVLSMIEKYILKTSKINIYVSNYMRDYYEKLYSIRTVDKSVIVPCYNKNLKKDSARLERKYTNPSFVYAGGLFAWQSIEKTLLIFKNIERIIPQATLSILTRDVTAAQDLVALHGIKNAVVKYVSLDQLDHELSRHKYGFLIREDCDVNNVSTPTKMNTYLASCVMPVYTWVVKDFEANLDLGEFCVKLNPEYDCEEMAKIIIRHHEIDIQPEKLLIKYQDNFDRYYNDVIYIDTMSNIFKRRVFPSIK